MSTFGAGDNSVVSQSGGFTCVDRIQILYFPTVDPLLLEVTIVELQDTVQKLQKELQQLK